VDVGVIDRVIVGIGVDVRNGVPVATIESAVGFGDDIVASSGSKADTFEQLTATINNNKNNRRTRLQPKRGIDFLPNKSRI
jgi:hypothetical protein